MDYEQRNGHAPLAGLNSVNGQGNGNGLPLAGVHDPLANGPLAEPAVNGHASENGIKAQAAAGRLSEPSPLDRRLEYVDRSVGAARASDQRDDDDDDFEVPRREAPRKPGKKPPTILQQVGEARRRQGLSIRCVAQRLGMTVGEVRSQEEPDADMPLSQLYQWQSVLEVPLEELLADPQDALSPKVMMRAQMLRVMKTARALRAQARTEGEHRLAKLLISQLIEIMPELKEVSAWPTVGHRRTADEMGRIAERPISDDFMHEAG